MRAFAGLGLREAARLPSIAHLLDGQKAPADLTLVLPDHLSRHALIPALRARHKVIFAPRPALCTIRTPTQSPRILARYGTGSLCEACALWAAGPHPLLITPRQISQDGMVTLALALAHEGAFP